MMMKIKTEQTPFEGFDSFKLTGSLDFGDAGKEAQAVIHTYGSRKSEAVEKAIKQIDSLIEQLEKSKARLGEI